MGTRTKFAESDVEQDAAHELVEQIKRLLGQK